MASRLRIAVVLLITAGCALSVATDWRSPVRVAFSLIFLFFGPGLAVTELLEVRDLALRIAIAIPVSLALDTMLALVLLYAGQFSMRLWVAILTAVTLATVAVALLRALRYRRPRAGP